MFKNILVIIPFFLVYIGSIYSVIDKPLSTSLRIFAFIYMIFYVILKSRFNKNLLFVASTFFIYLIYAIGHSWNIKAGINDGIRYLFPIVVLFYSYAIRKHYKLLFKFLVFFVVLNLLVQFVNYFNWARGINQWFYYKTKTGYIYYAQAAGIIRATGLVVFFSFYGFLNLISFFIIYAFYQGKYKNTLLIITLLSVLASLSFKAFGVMAIIFVIYFYKKIYKVIFYILILCITIYLFIPTKINPFISELLQRINTYITQGNSTRSESYRVMLNEIFSGNFFGRGVGTFGGPASVKFNSPFYKEVNFNWYDTAWLNLQTTDTFPPHLFVELGLFGGLLYLFVLTIPLFRKKANKYYVIVLIIYFALFFDMLFSFSLNNLEYILFSLIFVYPIFEYEKQQN